MKRSLLLLAAFSAVVVLYAGQAVIDFSQNLFPTDSATFVQQDTFTYVSGEVTLTALKAGSNTAPRVDKDHFRFYKSTTLTLSSLKTITQIDFTAYGTYTMSSVTADVGTLTDNSWTGSSSSIVFTTGAQTRLQTIVVTYSDDSAAVVPADTIEPCYTIAELKTIYQELNLASRAISAQSYTARGYVTKWGSGYPTYPNAEFYIDDTSDGSTTDVRCYRLVGLTPADERTYAVGDYVEIKGQLQNYNGNMEIIQGTVHLLSADTTPSQPTDTILPPKPRVVTMTCAGARAATLALATGEYSIDTVIMTGYVSQTNGVISRGQQCFWLSDNKDTQQTFYSYYSYLPSGVTTPLAVGDKVTLKGVLFHYSDDSPEIKNGTITILEKAPVTPTDPIVAAMQNLTAQYDTSSHVFFGVKFEEEVCNELVMVGTYKMNADSSWVSDPAELIHMQAVPGYTGWYVAVLPYSEGLKAKPVQLLADGTFLWHYQTGDYDSWQYVAGKEAEVYYNGYEGESELMFPEAGIYVYRSLYFKNHLSACNDTGLKTYTITLLPPSCDGYEPAIIGSFNDWSEGLPMQRNSDGTYTYILETYSGTEFKFRQAGISDWSNEIFLYNEEDDMWYANPNLSTGENTEIFIDYSNGTYNLCGSTPSLSSRAKLLWPVIADDRLLTTYSATIVSDFRENSGNPDNHLYVWGDTVGSEFAPSYISEWVQNGGSMGDSYGYSSFTVSTLGWTGFGNYVGGSRQWLAADMLRRYIVTNPDKFFLHLAVKSQDEASHAVWLLGNDQYGVTIGSTPVDAKYPVYQDFARDGEWHELNIPMVLFAEAMRAYSIDTADNVFALTSEAIPGVTLGLDNVYFFCTERFANLNPPLARVITEPEVALEGTSTEPLYSEEPQLTITADINATIAVTDGYGVLFEGDELTVTSGDSVIFTVRAPWPLMGNGMNTLYISGNIIITSTPSSAPSSSATHRRLSQLKEGMSPDLNDTGWRHPAISRFADVVVADDIQLCAVYYTDGEGNTQEGDPSRVSYHAAEQAYGEVDVDTQSFVPATSLVFADGNFYTDYIDGKIDIINGIVTVLPEQKEHTQKVIIDGNVYIIRGGKYYTPLGASVF